jgi:hypothetical protein
MTLRPFARSASARVVPADQYHALTGCTGAFRDTFENDYKKPPRDDGQTAV